jgi:hypothetical protein
MDSKLQNLIGWILLLAGLAAILWTVYFSYNIFTARAPAPEIFKVEKEIQTFGGTGKIPATQAELQKEMEKLISEQLKGLLPVDALPKLLNLISWSFFAGILILAGAQTSGLGIKIIKK